MVMSALSDAPHAGLVLWECLNVVHHACQLLRRKLYELGFDISYHALAGPFLTKDQVYDPTAPAPPFEVFGKRRD
jgi:hypothetical protein